MSKDGDKIDQSHSGSGHNIVADSANFEGTFNFHLPPSPQRKIIMIGCHAEGNSKAGFHFGEGVEAILLNTTSRNNGGPGFYQEGQDAKEPK